MKGKKVYALTSISLLLTISFISTIEAHAVEQNLSFSIKQKVSDIKQQFPILKGYDKEALLDLLKATFSKDVSFRELASNFTALDLIGALFGSLLFLLLSQPLFLQFIVETGNQFLFIILLVSLLLIEVFQKFFSLKVIGIWDPYIKNDIDGLWNFFSIMFFTVYIKIYLSYIPAFIIQYSNVLTQVFFYALMFAIPILFNICIADSIDLIDWNGDEFPVPPVLV
jgi:hypothetical protein